jgi:hypothetical protein
VKTDRDALRAAVEAAQPAAAAAGKAFLEVRTNGEDLPRRSLSDVRAFLTPEQQARLDGYISTVKRWRNGWKLQPGVGSSEIPDA